MKVNSTSAGRRRIEIPSQSLDASAGAGSAPEAMKLLHFAGTRLRGDLHARFSSRSGSDLGGPAVRGLVHPLATRCRSDGVGARRGAVRHELGPLERSSQKPFDEFHFGPARKVGDGDQVAQRAVAKAKADRLPALEHRLGKETFHRQRRRDRAQALSHLQPFEAPGEAAALGVSARRNRCAGRRYCRSFPAGGASPPMARCREATAQLKSRRAES